MELAAGTDGRGVTQVSELVDTLELSSSLAVHTGLGGTVADDLSTDNLSHTSETSLLVLHDRSHGGDGGSESLTGILHLLGSLGAGSGDVLHGLREARVGESSGLGVGSADGSRGSLALSNDLGLKGGHVRLHR